MPKVCLRVAPEGARYFGLDANIFRVPPQLVRDSEVLSRYLAPPEVETILREQYRQFLATKPTESFEKVYATGNSTSWQGLPMNIYSALSWVAEEFVAYASERWPKAFALYVPPAPEPERDLAAECLAMAQEAEETRLAKEVEKPTRKPRVRNAAQSRKSKIVVEPALTA